MQKDMKPVRILDSTLREGEQHPGVSFTEKQRVQMAWELDAFGVDQIEIAPLISAGHKSAAKTILGMGLHADIVCHGRAVDGDIDLSASLGAKWCAAYIGISDIHLRDKLRITRDEAEVRAVRVIELAKSYGMRIRLTLEDGARADPEFATHMARAAENAGADRISLPDTVGGMLPGEMNGFVRMIRRVVKCGIDVHCHNDMGLALANSLAGINAGADQMHVTINGVGERTGIPALAEAAVIITQKMRSSRSLRLHNLSDLSAHFSMYTGLPTSESQPVVGSSAFKHKAGTHLLAILRNPKAYEVIPPAVVGNRRKAVIGDLTGSAGAAHLLKILGVDADSSTSRTVTDGLKSFGGDVLEIDMPDNTQH